MCVIVYLICVPIFNYKAMVKQLNETGLGASAIAKEMGINRRSVYRALGA